MPRYSVLLLYPLEPYENPETFYAFVEAEDPNQAVILAQKEAVKANSETMSYLPMEFEPLLVTEGENPSLPLYNK